MTTWTSFPPCPLMFPQSNKDGKKSQPELKTKETTGVEKKKTKKTDGGGY